MSVKECSKNSFIIVVVVVVDIFNEISKSSAKRID